jgi:hypothetical protein
MTGILLEEILGGQKSVSIVDVIATDPYKLRPSTVLRAEFQALAGLSQGIEFVVEVREGHGKKESHFECVLQHPDWASEQPLQLVPALQYPTGCRWTTVQWNDQAWMDSTGQSGRGRLHRDPDTMEEAVALTFHLRSKMNFRLRSVESLNSERDSAVSALPFLHAGPKLARGHISQDFLRCRRTPSFLLKRQNEHRRPDQELGKCYKGAEHPQS